MKSNKQSPIRVAFLESRHYSLYGAQQSFLTLLRNLDRERIEPLVLLTKDGALAAACRESDIPLNVVALPEYANVFGNQIPHYSVWNKLRVALAILSINVRALIWLRQNRIGYVYCNEGRSLLYVGFGARLLRIPLLWYVRADQRLKGIHWLGVRLATRIVTVAQGARAAFSERELERCRRKFVTIYTGFTTDSATYCRASREKIRKSLDVTTSAFIIGLVGSVCFRKGHDILVRAIELIRDDINDLHVLFVGDALPEDKHFQDDVKAMLSRSSLCDRVHWMGFRTDVYEIYSTCDVVVLPSRSEGLPRTVCEALMVGLPVVVSDVGGAREIVSAPYLGHVVPKEDPGALAAVIYELYVDPMRQSSENRHKRCRYVTQKFSIDRYVKNVTEVMLADISRLS